MTRLPALLLLAAAPALATAGFPSVVATHLSLPTAPTCALCHPNNVTGPGTVTTPVGKALVAKGLVAYDDASLRSALDALQAAGTDSDGDGAGDVAELKTGTDPNVAGETNTGPAGPIYGCGGQVAPGLLAAASMAWLLRRRAARR